MSFSIVDLRPKVQSKCMSCIHFIKCNDEGTIGQCACNFDFKFSRENCNTNKFNNKEDVRKCHICFCFKQINDANEIKYVDSGLGCIIENNCNDEKVINKVKDELLLNAKNMLKENNINIKGDLFPIIFAEKVNGFWNQIFFGFTEEYSKILFNRLD